MRPFKRLPPPFFLISKCDEWGMDWERRRTLNTSATFHWHQHEGQPVNLKLLPRLKEQVQAHCSFCDAYPVSPPSPDTIEHFKPKAQFPREAYKWENLYYCCGFCQGKRAEFDEALLRPDSNDFDFDRYFRWDFTTGELLVNEIASPEDRKRAEVTIRLYRLNVEHPSWRKREALRYQRLHDESLENCAYRHYVGYPTTLSQS